jgi:AcrR family transcriptional regulator
MARQIALKNDSSHTRRRITDAARRLYREIGYRKTTMADVAHGASMSPANVYRFFSSRQALEEAVLAALFDEMFIAAATPSGGEAPALEQLGAILGTLAQLHEDRRANDAKLHELVAAAARGNYPAVLAYADRVRGVVQSIIEVGQASGEIRPGNPMVLACCLLDAMDAYIGPSPAKSSIVRPTFEEMMKFCASALRNDARLPAIGAQGQACFPAGIYQS